jgi:hypothetical protein
VKPSVLLRRQLVKSKQLREQPRKLPSKQQLKSKPTLKQKPQMLNQQVKKSQKLLKRPKSQESVNLVNRKEVKQLQLRLLTK